MNFVGVIVAAMLLLGLVPLFILLGIAGRDLGETRRQIRQNEKEIHEMIYGKKED